MRLDEHPAGVLEVDGERLLGVDGLPLPERGQRDRGVRLRDRQVEDDLDLLLSEEIRDAEDPSYAVPGGLLPGPTPVKVCARDDLHVFRGAAVLEVDVADLAAPYQAHPDCRVFDDPFSSLSGSPRASRAAPAPGLPAPRSPRRRARASSRTPYPPPSALSTPPAP